MKPTSDATASPMHWPPKAAIKPSLIGDASASVHASCLKTSHAPLNYVRSCL